LRSLSTAAGSVALREIRPADARGLTEFYATLSDGVALFFEPFPSMDAGVADQIIGKHLAGREAHYVVETTDGGIVGHCFLWGMDIDEPEIGIGLAEPYQNQGLGQTMMGTLIDRARSAMKPSVRLTVFVENARARHVYEKLGFAETGRRDVVRGARFGGRRMTLIEMRRPLAET
jgi:RimJ/RimL family protein N-acetyltransferase